MNSDDDRSSVSSDQSRSQTKKGSFRRRLQSISSTADRSRHSFIDGTKTVSSRIVKKALRRRASSEIREIQEEPKDDHRIAQEAREIFETIKFEFPAFVSDKKFSRGEGPPPPSFPPPSLPESYYEDVFSVDQWSNNSYSDSQYELLDRHDLQNTMSIPLFSHGSFDSESDRLSSSLSNELEIREFLIDGYDDKKYEEEACESLSALVINDIGQNENKAVTDSLFSSSETSSSGRSMEVRSFEYSSSNSRNHSYENWNLRSRREEAASPVVPLSAPLQSVISEFDPLFDSISSEADLPFDDLNFFASDSNKSGEGEGTDSPSAKESETSALNELHSLSSEKLAEFLAKGKRKNSIKSAASIAGWSNMKKAVKAVSYTHLTLPTIYSV